ncbi:MAG: TolC family protein [Gemmatimonadetes bacterium]|nr:TolC family protein [Gemmatimonadota bacterium]
MRRLICTLLVLGAAPFAHVSAQASGPVLTLDEAIRLAVRNNPQYLQTGSSRQRAAAALRASKGQLLPTVRTSFGSSYREGRQQFFAGQAFGSTSDVLSSSADLGVDLAISAATWMARKQQQANLAAAESDVTSAEATLRANVITQYLNVLQALSRATLQDTLLRSTQAQLELARARQQVGAATTLDVRRAEVQVGQQQVAVLRERNNVEVEKLRLFQQIGVEQPAGVSLSSQFAIEEPKVQLDALLGQARSGNPALAALRSRERASDVQVSSARSAYFPSLSLSSGVSGFSQQLRNIDGSISDARASALSQQRSCISQDSLRRGAGLPSILQQCGAIVFTDAQASALRDANAQFPFKMTRSPIQLSAQISLPIFDGFTREQRIQEAAASRNDARYRVREQELKLTADVTSAYRNLVTAYQTVRLQEQNTVAAREALSLSQERFRVGANTFVDVTQSRSDFERAETDRINAIYDYHKAFAALESAVGRPLR